jgi:hypothetical protein
MARLRPTSPRLRFGPYDPLRQRRADTASNLKCYCRTHMTSATFSLKPYYSASATSGGGVPWSSREKESQHEDESIDGHGRWCSGSLGRWCYVDRTIGVGW